MAAKDLGPLDWRTPIVDSSGRPSPQFQRLWNTQRNNNALIGTVTFDTGAPTGSPEDGALYVDTSTTPWTLYIGDASAWNILGVQDFINLHDVPGNYTSAANDLVTVNGNATGLVFGNLTSVLDGMTTTQGSILFRGVSVWEPLAPGTAGYVLSTNGPGADPSWVPQAAPTPTAHRYWRFLVTTDGSGAAVLAEAGFCTTLGGSTVTTGGTPISSSDFSSFVKANAFDGNPSTDWATSDGAGVAYIGYDFGSGNDQTIVDSYIQASATFTSQAPAAVDIDFSDNGVTWTTAWAGIASTWSPGQIQRFS